MLPVKRSLFQTPTRPRKRSRTTKKKSAPMRIPKSLLPETKQFIVNSLTTNSTNYAYSSIPIDMSQGDGSNQFVGSKFRIQRVRVNYDFSQLSLTSGVRILAVIPKDPSLAPTSVVTTSRAQVDTQLYTVLHDMLLPDSPDTATGTFDIKGPINVEMNSGGTGCTRNNVHIFVFSLANGANLALDFSYSVWFTDA